MIAGLLALSLAAGVQAQERTLLPGYADLPVIAGDPACGLSEAEGGTVTATDCVTVPLETLNEVFYEYVGLLRRSGWRFTGGAAIVFYFQRDRQGGGCEGIDLAAMADFEMLERPESKPEDMRFPSMIMFMKRPEVACVAEGL